MTLVAVQGVQGKGPGCLSWHHDDCWCLQDDCKCLQVSDIDQERVESLCSPEAVQVAIKLRDLLNGSSRINPEDDATEGIDGISMVPAVSYTLPYTPNFFRWGLCNEH